VSDETSPATSSEAQPTAARSGLRRWASVYLKGAAMGAADTVPGVSGGTIALITGVYERFVRALTRLSPDVLRHVTSVHRQEGRRDLLEELRRMDLLFLIVLGLGVLTSVVTLSRLVHTALETMRAHTFAFFFGLIAASAVVLYRELSVSSVGQATAAVVGFAFAFAVSGAAAEGVFANSLPIVFLTGAIAITAMVLPGISGSFLLILLGQYDYLVGVLERFVDGVIATLLGGSSTDIVSLSVVIGVFGCGAIIGLLSVAHAIRWALDNYRAATLAFLVSLMVGSLRLPVLEITTNVDAWTPVAAVTILAAVTIGAGAVLLLDYYTADLSEMAA
jgi:putative membrane protein